MRPIRQHRTDTTTRLLSLGLLLCVGVGWTQTDTGVEWEFIGKDGVVERRPQPPPQVIDLKAAGLPIPIEVETKVVPAGPGRVIEVERMVYEGRGGRPFEGDFGASIGPIVEGPDGHIWVGIREGLCRFDGQTWILYSAGDGLPSFSSILDMKFDAAGHIWFALGETIVRFDGQQSIQYKWHRRNLLEVAISPNGDVWTGSGDPVPSGAAIYKPLLYRFDGTNWWEYSSNDGLPSEGGSVISLDIDQKGTVWASLWPSETSIISFSDSLVANYTVVSGVMLADSKGRLWVGGGNGLVLKDGPIWYLYPKDAENWISMSTIYEDRFGRIWVGGTGNTWGALDEDIWSYYHYDEFSAVMKGALVDRQGYHWIALGDHLVRWRPDSLPTNIQNPSQTPTASHLNQNHPNPFNAETTIAFHLARRQSLSLTVFNLAGQPVRTLMAGDFGPGPYQARWDGRDDRGQPAASGLYLYRLQTPERSFTRKMVLLK